MGFLKMLKNFTVFAEGIFLKMLKCDRVFYMPKMYGKNQENHYSVCAVKLSHK